MTTAWGWLQKQVLVRKAALRFCARVTIAAILAFTLMQFWSLPLRGLWAVLTAVVVMQTSVGASLRATTEYVIGTLFGAVYASALGQATLAVISICWGVALWWLAHMSRFRAPERFLLHNALTAGARP